jgi:hypothetical protein
VNNNAPTADLIRLAQDAVAAGNFAGATAFKDMFVLYGGNTDEWTVVIPASAVEADEARNRAVLAAHTKEQVEEIVVWAATARAAFRFDAAQGETARKDGLDTAGFIARYPEAPKEQVMAFNAWSIIKAYQAAQRFFGIKDVVGANAEALQASLLEQGEALGL